MAQVIVAPERASAALPGTNGRIVYYAVNAGGLWTMLPDGSDVSRITGPSYGSLDPAWSPDGTAIAYHAWHDIYGDYLTVVNADGSAFRELVPGSYPDWSPDGNRIAFVRRYSIMSVAPDGTDVRTIADFESLYLEMRHLAWSPNGSKIAFAARSGLTGGNDIYVVDASGENLTKLTHDVGGDTSPTTEVHPDWSPDGSKIVFSVPGYYTNEGVTGVYVMNSDGTGIQKLHGPTGESWPVWSPDGTRIAFIKSARVHVMNSDGSNVTPLLSSGTQMMPDWRPCLPSESCGPPPDSPILPPQVSISIKKKPGGLPFTVSWADSRPLGVAFDVKYKVGSGVWKSWKTDTLSLSGVFGKQGKPVLVKKGKKYSFKARWEYGSSTGPWCSIKSFRP